MPDQERINITRHAKNRLKKRGGLRPSAQQKVADLANGQGLQSRHFSGAMRRYLDGYYLKYPREFVRGSRVRVFRNLVWVFRGRTLITVIQLPSRFTKYVARKSQEQNNE